jgi:Uma2 family endonuclease
MEPIAISFPQTLQLDDDEFYRFCQANPKLQLESNKDGEILIKALPGGKTGITNSEIIAELIIWNR